MLIVRHHEVRDILAGRAGEVIDIVRAAYRLHDEGRTVVPHSTFLRPPSVPGKPDPGNRIIGLPAYHRKSITGTKARKLRKNTICPVG